MDVVLNAADSYLLDGLYGKWAPQWDREALPRQAISLYAITLIGVWILYFGIGGLSYAFIFDKRMMKHPRFIKGQIKLEMAMSFKGFPVLDLMTLPWFLGECRGYSLMYEGIENSPFGHGRAGGIAYIVFSSALFLWFTDLSIYLVHRVLHWPSVYKHLHKPHHKWVIPTPFASHAFHPIDGYAQSLPYHMFVYLVPLHKYTYLGLFVVVNLWSIFIHDSDMITGHPLEKIINGPAHHTLHHMYFVVNYGQYFTWADKVGGSYRHPKNEDDPIHAIISREEARERLAAEKAALALAETKTETEAIAATTTTAVAKTSTMLRTQSNSDQSSRSRRSSQSGRSTPDLTEEEDATEEEEDVREAVTPFEELSASAAALRQRRTRTGTGKNAQLQP